MHAAAEMGAAAHSSYKGGFKEDPGAAEALAELVAAANAAAERRFGSFTETGGVLAGGASDADRVFRMFDLDGDGRVTREELRAVIGDVWRGGAGGGAALEDDGGAAADLLAAIDADEDGTVSPEEFARFRTSLKVLGSLPGADAAAKRTIDVAAAGGGKKEAEGEEEEEEQGDHGSASSGDHASASSGDHGSSGSSGSSGAGVGSSATSAPDASYVVTVPISKRVGPLSTSAPPSSERGAAETSSSARTSADASAASLAAPPPPLLASAVVEAALKAVPPGTTTPSLPPAPPRPSTTKKMRSADDVVRDASKALRETKSGAATAVDWQLAWDLMRAGRQETAREIFYQRAAKHPGASELWEQWARFELLQGDAERARGLYRAALLNAEGLDPRRRAETLRKWGVMEFGAGDAHAAAGLFERALAVLEEAEQRGDGEEGDEEKKGGGEDDARDESLASASASVSSLRAARCVVLHAYAQTRAKTGDPTSARGLLRRAQAADPSNPRVPHLLARLAENERDFDSARATYAAAHGAFPNDAHLALSRARLESAAFGAHEAAREIFRDAVAKAPENYRLWHAWAVMESRAAGDARAGADAARPMFARAADAAPWSAHAWCAWAEAERAASRVGDATREDARGGGAGFSAAAAAAEKASEPAASSYVERARALYAEGLRVEPTNARCLAARRARARRGAGDRGEGLPRARPRPRAGKRAVRLRARQARGGVRQPRQGGEVLQRRQAAQERKQGEEARGGGVRGGGKGRRRLWLFRLGRDGDARDVGPLGGGGGGAGGGFSGFDGGRELPAPGQARERRARRRRARVQAGPRRREGRGRREEAR